MGSDLRALRDTLHLMRPRLCLALPVLLAVGCTSKAPDSSSSSSAQAVADAQPAVGTPEEGPTTANTEAVAEPPVESTPGEAPTEVEPTPSPEPQVPDDEGEDEEDEEDEAGAAAAPEIPLVEVGAWKTSPQTASWREVPSPASPLEFVSLSAGVLAKAPDGWFQLGADGAFETVSFDREPSLPLFGVFPKDAWYVDERIKKEEPEFEYTELRLMKLRNNTRWVPQVYGPNGEQWFHPGTDDGAARPKMSHRSGMLVIAGDDGTWSAERVAGNRGNPEIGLYHGELVDVVETGSGPLYTLSSDFANTYAQIHCTTPDCQQANARRLPEGRWSFGPDIARGKFSVTVLARSGGRNHLLHHRGKDGGWLIEPLPEGAEFGGMWATAEGGMWMLLGGELLWRDTDSHWHTVALPPGLGTPSVAIDAAREHLWIAGAHGAATKVFTSPAKLAASE
jgi:hypothetical protein